MDPILHTTSSTQDTDTARLREATTLRHRADSLRQQSQSLDDVLGVAYRRRASELEIEAWVTEIQAGALAHGVHSAA